MLRPKRASVESQVNLQPFLLGQTSASPVMSRPESSNHGSKRDSGFSDMVKSFPLGANGLRRITSKKHSRAEGSNASDSQSPVYRLYPHQNANGSKQLRAMPDKTEVEPESSHKSFETTIYSPNHPAHPGFNNIGTAETTDEPTYAGNTSLTALPNALVIDDYEEESRPVSRDSFATPDESNSPVEGPSDRLDAPFEESYNRGRAETPTYIPKGYPPLDRASSLSSTGFRSSSRISFARPASRTSLRMGLHKVSSNGQIADIESPTTPDTMTETFGAGDRSSAESAFSHETTNTSLTNLPPLQTKAPDNDIQHLEPLLEDDPSSFDLVDPSNEADEPAGIYALEERADLMLSDRHLQAIFDEPKLLMKFTSFLNLHRPQSIPLLIYYLDALKAIRAIKYANAIAEALEAIPGQDFTKSAPKHTTNTALEQRANDAFKVLAEEDLPAYISYVWIQVVSTSIQRRITGTLAPHLREASEGLAETFCLSDPSRKDNPIVFCSEEFARTTQYGMTYAIGRNCRFLQGPRTRRESVKRLAMACAAGKEHNEVFVNYRRDGSPFLNLLMIAPLMDSKGNVRYYIGAQVDVSGLLKGCNELPALASLVEEDQRSSGRSSQRAKRDDDDDEFQNLAEMFNTTELDTVRKYGGRMHKEYVDDSDNESLADRRPRVLLKDTSQDILEDNLDQDRAAATVPSVIREKINGKLEGVYQHYLLLRPAPSLRILFTSPSLRVPGILQSSFLHRIGGSPRVRSDLAAALADGRGVTAKVRWLFRADEYGEGEGRSRWIHCTPLLGHSGAVGVWMVVLVEEEGQVPGSSHNHRFRSAPPVSSQIGGKDWSTSKQSRKTSHNYAQDLESARRGVSMASSIERDRTVVQGSRDRSVSRGGERATSVPRGADSIVGQAISAPSPDVPDKRPARTSAIDFEGAAEGPRVPTASSRMSTYSTPHVVRQMEKGRPSTRGSAADEFSFDLK